MGGLGLLPSSLDDYVRRMSGGMCARTLLTHRVLTCHPPHLQVGSDFSFAQLHLTVPRSICSFGQANNLIIGTPRTPKRGALVALRDQLYQQLRRCSLAAVL
jgi:hypothetical protein